MNNAAVTRVWGRFHGKIFTVGLSVVLWASSAAPGRARADAATRESLAEEPAGAVTADWLITPPTRRAGVYRGGKAGEIILSNGLIRRTFRIAPDAATVGFDNLMNGQSLLRGVKPEAVVEIDGAKFNVGGLNGQP